MVVLTQMPLAHCGGLLSAAPCAWDLTSTRLVSASGRHVRVHGLGLPARRPRSLTGHESSVVAVATLAPARALTAGRDGVLRVWDVDDALCLRTVDLGEPVRDAVAPAHGCPGSDGRVIVACKAGVHAVHLGKATAGTPMLMTLWKDMGATRVACDHSGMFVCGIKEQTLFICQRSPQESESTRADLEDMSDEDGDAHMGDAVYSANPIHRVHHARSLASVAVSADGSIVAVGCDNGEIHIYRDVSARLRNIDADSFVQSSKLAPARLHWHAGAVSALAFAGGGSALLSGGAEAVLVVWKMSRAEFGDRSFRPRLGGAIWGISVSPDDAKFAVTCADNAVRVLNAFSMSVEVSFQGLSVPIDESLDGRVAKRKGRELVLGSVKGMSILPEPGTEGYVFIYGVGPAVQIYNVIRGEHVAFLPVVPRNAVHVAGTGPERASVPRQPSVEFVCLSSDSELMATIDSQDFAGDASNNRSAAAIEVLRFWRRNADGAMKMLARVDRPHGPRGQVRAIEFHPTLPVLATSSLGGDFKLWRMVLTRVSARPLTWRCEAVGEHRGLPCGPLAFSPDGSLLAVANANTISLWHVHSVYSGDEEDGGAGGERDPIYDGCITEGSPRSLDMQIVHTFVHPPAEEHICDVKFMAADGPFIVATTEHGVYVWHVLGRCIWWTIRLCTLGVPITVDYQSNRFAVGIELFNADPGAHANSTADSSLRGEDETQSTVHTQNRCCSIDGQTKDSDGREITEDISSFPTGTGFVDAGRADSDKKLRKRLKGSVTGQGDTRRCEPRKRSSCEIKISRASGQASSPIVRGEGMPGLRPNGTDPLCGPGTGGQDFVTEQDQTSHTIRKIASGHSTKPATVIRNSKLLSKGISGNPSSKSRTDKALLVFNVSSPVPLCVHPIRNQAKLLAAAFVKAPRSFCTNDSCPLVFVDSNLDVHAIVAGDEPSAVTAAGNSAASVDGDWNVEAERQHNLDDLLGEDWRERMATSHPATGAGRSLVNAGISGPSPLDGRINWVQGPRQLNDIECAIAAAFDGPTHTLAPVSVTCPDLIRSLFSSPALPTSGYLKAVDTNDSAAGTVLANDAQPLGAGVVEGESPWLMSMDASGWHYERRPVKHRGSDTEDNCSARLLRFTKLFADPVFARGATRPAN
jgi:WD40 repeat protein